MLIHDFISGFDIISKQCQSRFYRWEFGRDLARGQREELIRLLNGQHFDKLADKIKLLIENHITDGKQQIGRVVFEDYLHKKKQRQRRQLIQLVKSGLVDVNVRVDSYGRTLLHWAALDQDVELVKILVDHNANIKSRDSLCNTALHSAISSYRTGNGLDAVRNLTQILKILLLADRFPRRSNLENEYQNKKVRLAIIPHIDPIKLKNIRNNETSPAEQEYQNLDQSHDSYHGCLNDEPLIDMRDFYGKTALHSCVNVTGAHLTHFVKLLLYHGADPDIVDEQKRTPLYCLVKNGGGRATRHQCKAILELLDVGCDDLGLALSDISYFSDKVIENLKNKPPSEIPPEAIFTMRSFKRVPSLKHLARLNIVRNNYDVDLKTQRKVQKQLSLPITCPATLTPYVNRKILDQSEL